MDPEGQQYLNNPPPEKISRQQGWNQYPLPVPLTPFYTFMIKQHPNFRASDQVTAMWLNSHGKALTSNRVSSSVQAACWVLGNCLSTPLDIRRNMITLLADKADKLGGDDFLAQLASLQGTSLAMIKSHYNIRFHNEAPKQVMSTITKHLGY